MAMEASKIRHEGSLLDIGPNTAFGDTAVWTMAEVAFTDKWTPFVFFKIKLVWGYNCGVAKGMAKDVVNFLKIIRICFNF